jgi:hypothetical protein
MNLEFLKEEWSKDCVIDETKITQASLGTAKLHSKYLNILVETKQKITLEKHNLNKIKKLKTRYYKGELTKPELEKYGWDQYQYNKPLKSELNDILDGDDDVIQKKEQIEYLETKLYFLESVLGSLRNRGFDIKNAIEWGKYLLGN